MQKKGSVVCWVVDDTGFPKKGSHSVGVSRQYCGQVGKQENCRVAVSLSVATWTASLPIAWRLYLPEIWASDPKRRKQAGIPENIQFETKPQIALGQIRQALEQEMTPGIVVADAGYGVDTQFRRGLSELVACLKETVTAKTLSKGCATSQIGFDRGAEKRIDWHQPVAGTASRLCDASKADSFGE
jgi:SRSO17 transposase